MDLPISLTSFSVKGHFGQFLLHLVRSGQPLRGLDGETLVSSEHHIRRLASEHSDQPRFVSFTRCLSEDKRLLGNNEQKKYIPSDAISLAENEMKTQD